MRKTRMTPIGANTFLVRVDDYADGVLKGAMYSTLLAELVHFNSLPRLFIAIDDLLDEGEELADACEITPVMDGFAPSFELEVLFRQNHSWQGRIRLLDSRREATFRSALELMFVLETAYGA